MTEYAAGSGQQLASMDLGNCYPAGTILHLNISAKVSADWPGNTKTFFGWVVQGSSLADLAASVATVIASGTGHIATTSYAATLDTTSGAQAAWIDTNNIATLTVTARYLALVVEAQFSAVPWYSDGTSFLLPEGTAPSQSPISCPGSVAHDVYKINPPGTSISFLATLTDAEDKSIRPVRNQSGSGQFSINRYSANATAAIIAPGNLVKVRYPEIGADHIFSWFMEKGDFTLVSSNEQGGEVIRIGGRGALSYWDRAVWLSENFVVPWWPSTMGTPPAGTKGALQVVAGTYRQYTVVGGTNVTAALSLAADDIIDTAAAHGFVVGQKVRFTSITGGAGLVVGTRYYVIAASLGTTTVKLSATPGGAAINFTTNITAGVLVGDPTITGYADFTTTGFSAYYGATRQTYQWPSANSKRFLVKLTTTEDPAAPSYVGYYFHPHQAGVTETLPTYATGTTTTVLLSDISPDKPGAVLYRMWQEATNASRPIQPIPLMTVDFTATTDSTGAAWSTTDALAGMTAELGETFLETIAKLVGTGVIDVEMGPNLDMHAYNSRGVNRASATFAAGKVRFAKGVNIADDLGRERDDGPVPTWKEVVGLDGAVGQVALADAATRVARESAGKADSNVEATLQAVGLAELNARLVRSDAVGFAIATGTSELTGFYLPGPVGSTNGKFWLGDTVRLHTGTGEHDYNEQDLRVSAFTIGEDAAGNLNVVPEVGSVLGEAERALYAGSAAPSGGSFTTRSQYSEAEVAEPVAGLAGTLPWFNVKNYGAIGNGVADDTAAINLAIAALNAATRGVLYVPAGDYKVSAGLTTITAAAVIKGDGSSAFDDSVFISRIFSTSGTAVVFTVTSKVALFEHLDLVSISGGTPTAGSAIQASGSYIHQRVDYNDLHVRGFYDCIDVQVGAHWVASGVLITNPVRYGFRIRNTVNPDAGDWSIIGCNFNADSYNGSAAIRVESSGGGKISNTKINRGAPATLGQFVTGLDIAMGTGSSTSVLTLTGTSIENVTGDAVSIVTTGTGNYGLVSIAGLQVGLHDNNTGRAVKVSAASTGSFGTAGTIAGVVVDSSTFYTNGTARAAIALTNCDNIVLGDIAILGFNARYTSSGATNITDGNGAPSGAAGGDLSGTYPNPSVVDDSHAHTSATAPGSGDHEHIVGETFSGNAVTTDFEIANEPIDAEAVAGYVAGLRVALTVSGGMNTTVTFAVAPASGTDNVVIDYPAVSVA